MLLLLFCWGQDALKQKNLPLGGFSGLYMASLLGPFSLTKRAMHEPGKLNEVQFHVAQIQGKILQKAEARLGAFNDKAFRALRRSTKDAVFGNCHLLKRWTKTLLLQRLGAAR